MTTNSLQLRPATREEVPAIVNLYIDDALGQTRETFGDQLPQSYWDAFDAIAADPNNTLMVLTDEDTIVGTLQLTFIPHLVFEGGIRCQVEAVRIDKSRRGQSLGQKMFAEVKKLAEERNCHVIQLTMNKTRDETRRFYERLGFSATHDGMKLYLS